MEQLLCRVPKQYSKTYNDYWVQRLKVFMTKEGFLNSESGQYTKGDAVVSLSETDTDFIIGAVQLSERDQTALLAVINSIFNPNLSGYRVDPAMVAKEVSIVTGVVAGFIAANNALSKLKLPAMPEAAVKANPKALPAHEVVDDVYKAETLADFSANIQDIVSEFSEDLDGDKADAYRLAWSTLLSHAESVSEQRANVNIYVSGETAMEVLTECLAKVKDTPISPTVVQRLEEYVRRNLMRRNSIVDELSKGSPRFVVSQNKLEYKTVAYILDYVLQRFVEYVADNKTYQLFENDLPFITREVERQMIEVKSAFGDTFDKIVERASKSSSASLKYPKDKLYQLNSEADLMGIGTVVDILQSYHPDTELGLRLFNQIKYNVDLHLTWLLWDSCQTDKTAAALNESFLRISKAQEMVNWQFNKILRNHKRGFNYDITVADLIDTLYMEHPEVEEARAKLVPKKDKGMIYSAKEEGASRALEYVLAAVNSYDEEKRFSEVSYELFETALDNFALDVKALKSERALTTKDKVVQQSCREKIKDIVIRLRNEIEYNATVKDVIDTLSFTEGSLVLNPPSEDILPFPEVTPWNQISNSQLEWQEEADAIRETYQVPPHRETLDKHPLGKKFESEDIKTASAIVTGSALLSLFKNTKFNTPVIVTPKGHRTVIRAPVNKDCLLNNPIRIEDALTGLNGCCALDGDIVEVHVWREKDGKEISLQEVSGPARLKGLRLLERTLSKYSKLCQFNSGAISVDPLQPENMEALV